MEYSHANVIRPWLATRKSQLIEYAQTHQIAWLEDPSNQDVEFAARNRIRHDILPAALKINPGLHNMVRKRIIEKLDRT
jgi:tRNA(Ile)-lysidine synthase TilS/MesJ